MHIFRIIHQKLNSKNVFQPLLVLHLTKIQFPTKNFVAKFYIKVYRFRPDLGKTVVKSLTNDYDYLYL